MIEQDLCEHTAGGVAHQDGGRLQLSDHALEMLDDRGNCQLLDRRRIRSERLNLDLEPRIRGGENAITAILVAGLPVLPASTSDPKAMYQNDGIGRDSTGIRHDHLPSIEDTQPYAVLLKAQLERPRRRSRRFRGR